ncbi:urease accessory protein UreD [Nocardia bovistercoris]|uniref:urease accessory protein UreD n=1 Tax=Nocardia bovistercoris TaxID=2785916 RepID=UPI001E6042A9|nr:urease accessory protein UreD [Nocardia bovistercoris]
MRTELRISVRAGESARVHASGGLAARRTGPDAVHLIGTAATPLGGDELDITVEVGPGARLVLRSVAASIALPGAATVSSSARWHFEVGAGGFLDVDLEPMVVAGGARHRVRSTVAFAGDAAIRLRERVQIGRAGERDGGWRGDLIADVDGVPLLRHRLELGAGGVTDDALASARALDSELVYPDDRPAAVLGAGAVRVPLAAGGSLFTGVAGALPVPGRAGTWSGAGRSTAVSVG